MIYDLQGGLAKPKIARLPNWRQDAAITGTLEAHHHRDGGHPGCR
jgi:hypothetical protein